MTDELIALLDCLTGEQIDSLIDYLLRQLSEED